MKNSKIIQRQGAFKTAGRLDLVVQDRLGTYILYELKRGIANKDTLIQVKGYMRAYSKEHRIPLGKIKGVILAQDADLGLLEAIKVENLINIKFRKYSFSVEMK